MDIASARDLHVSTAAAAAQSRTARPRRSSGPGTSFQRPPQRLNPAHAVAFGLYWAWMKWVEFQRPPQRLNPARELKESGYEYKLFQRPPQRLNPALFYMSPLFSFMRFNGRRSGSIPHGHKVGPWTFYGMAFQRPPQRLNTAPHFLAEKNPISRNWFCNKQLKNDREWGRFLIGANQNGQAEAWFQREAFPCGGTLP